MCQMASETLLRGSSLASCSSKALHQSLKASEYSCCSFFSPSMAKGVRTHQRLVCKTDSSQKPVHCQAIMPLPKHEQHVRVGACCDTEQQLPSPDRWMEDCVCDIVRNINEAPFLHMLFDSKDRRSGVKSKRQRVVETANASIEEKWREVKDSVQSASPDGVILVHHLDDRAMEGCCLRDGLSSGSVEGSIAEDRKSNKLCRSTNLWGVLVLGKSVARSACYILKTTSVASSFGTCTQFCLTKAKCFGPSWNDQVQSCWLLSTEISELVGK